jgi:hypothetical protein
MPLIYFLSSDEPAASHVPTASSPTSAAGQPSPLLLAYEHITIRSSTADALTLVATATTTGATALLLLCPCPHRLPQSPSVTCSACLLAGLRSEDDGDARVCAGDAGFSSLDGPLKVVWATRM